MLNDDDVLKVAEAHRARHNISWRLTEGFQITNPPAVYFTVEPPIPNLEYTGSFQFCVLRSNGRVVELSPWVLVNEYAVVIFPHGAPTIPEPYHEPTPDQWKLILEGALQKECRNAPEG
jgi:hypothetical protein